MNEDLTDWQRARETYRAMIGDKSKHWLDHELVEQQARITAEARKAMLAEIALIQKQIQDHKDAERRRDALHSTDVLTGEN